MKRILCISALCIFVLTISSNCFAKSLKPDIIVAKDGSGDFKTLQAAIDSIPKGNKERKVIYIKNGTYIEHILIENSFLTFVGQDRKKTRIQWVINDPRLAPEQHKDGKGVATLNMKDCNDIIIENLTIDNPANMGKKPFTVSSTGKGTRIVIQNADILGLGGDTLSLWTRGMYYHRNLYVTGTYHFVGPRGTCYISDSTLKVLSKVSNALFNEGMDDEREKFVLRNCTLISKEHFGLGSFFRDTAWYFIDCKFPDTLDPNGSIFIKAADGYKFKWPTNRIYFSGCKGPDYPWLKDNIAKSPAKTASAVTALWTFRGQWDPENTTAPGITGVSRAGEIVNVKFSEAVTVKGKPALKLADGKTAAYISGSGTDSLAFKAPTAAAPKTLETKGGMILASAASAQPRCIKDSLKVEMKSEK
jgi:pectinesterase